MCTLTRQIAQENPELALYGMVFNVNRAEPFTRESIEREISDTDAGTSMKAVLGRCLRNWLESELLYRSYDGYRIA